MSLVSFSAFSSEILKDKLAELVNINSGSQNFKGVNQVQQKLGSWLESIGFSVEFIKNPEGQISGDLLIANYPGSSEKTLTLVMHADTVFEPTSPFQRMEILSVE